MADHSTSTTTLSLYDATGILSTLMDTKKDIDLCDVCQQPYKDGNSWNICRFPDVPQSRGGIPAVHVGHTACDECAESLAYIGDAGSCIVCYNALGGRRSALKTAGVALRPPVKNQLATKFLHCFKEAEESIEAANEESDQARIQEGTDRRVAAVEDVRRRKEEARLKAEAEAEDLKMQAAEEAVELKKRAQEEAVAEAAELKKRAQEEADVAKAAVEKMQEDADIAKAAAIEEAEWIAARTRAEAEEAADQITTRAAAQAEQETTERRQQQEDALAQAREEGRAAAAALMPEQVGDQANLTKNGRPRKRKAISDEKIKARTEAANKTRADKKFKADQYPILLVENHVLKEKLKALMSTAKNAIEQAGGQIDNFEELVDAGFAAIEEENNDKETEEEEEEEEEQNGLVVD